MLLVRVLRSAPTTYLHLIYTVIRGAQRVHLCINTCDGAMHSSYCAYYAHETFKEG